MNCYASQTVELPITDDTDATEHADTAKSFGLIYWRERLSRQSTKHKQYPCAPLDPLVP
jgi:hypothetical protein